MNNSGGDGAERPAIGIGLVGYSFMGRTHSHGWRNARSFFDPALDPRRVAVAGRDRAGAADLARRFDWADVETDWRALIDRDDVQLVDICTPGDTHAEIALAALAADKHVLCEKPLANSLAEAETMADAAAAARSRGVHAMVGFTYRRVPAIALARELVREGRIGEIRHVRAEYLQDWLTDSQAPFAWRLDRDRAGSGALGDIGAHAVDLTHHVTGRRVTGVSAVTHTFVPERPLPDGSGTGRVTVDDAAVFLGRLEGGALATFSATRCATGRKNALRIEVSGTRGALAFDLEDLNSLQLYEESGDTRSRGFTRILATEADHPYVAGWWPPGHLLGYEHGFTHQAVDLLNAIGRDGEAEPTFADGLAVQRVLDAVERSAAGDSSWTAITHTAPGGPTAGPGTDTGEPRHRPVQETAP